jgi:hypothetical protein
MPKPFGKIARRGMGLTRAMRLVVALWVAALPAFLLCRIPARGRPTLAEDAFFWPSVFGLGLFYAIAIARWLRRRPSPRGPWESSRARLFVSRFLLALLVAAPMGFASAYCYEPAFTLANGLIPVGRGVTEHAMVVRDGNGFALDSPYWEAPFRFRIHPSAAVPRDLAAGSLAKLTLRRGLLGARFVGSIEYEVLR